MNQTISTYILEKLKTLNCNHVIGIPATNCAAFFDAIDNTDGIDYVIPTSELEAGYIADGYARTGQISALCVAYGVGTLSLANPVAGAFAEKLPIILLNGGPDSEEQAIEKQLDALFLHSTGKESSDYNVFKNITAYAEIIRHPSEAKQKIDEAFNIAIEKSQPVYLEVPSDFWHLPLESSTDGDTVYFKSILEKIVLNKLQEKFINHTKEEKFNLLKDLILKPSTFFKDTVFVIGPEVIRKDLSKDVLKFVEKYNISFLTTPLSKSFEGFFDDNLKPKNYWGCLDNITYIPNEKKEVIENAEFFICLGNIWGVDSKKFIVDNYSKMIDIGYGKARAGYKKFSDVGSLNNALLAVQDVFSLKSNTSEQSDKFNNFVKSSDFDEDIKSFLFGLNIDKLFVYDQDKLIKIINAILMDSRQRAPAKNTLSQDDLHTTIKEFIQCKEKSPELLFNVDACLSMFWGTETRLKSGDEYISNPAWLSIGHSAPASIGYYLKNKKIPFIITGDGGFQMISQTFSTMIKLKIPALIIVVNNSILGIEEYLLDPKSKREKAFNYTEVKPWNYENFPQIYNSLIDEDSKGYKVSCTDELNEVLDKWSKGVENHSIKHPWIINCIVDHDSRPERVHKKNTQKSNSLLSAFELR